MFKTLPIPKETQRGKKEEARVEKADRLNAF
jgi:hypothetical protein